ncbi:lytic murein transglycosylase [Altericroceibacterium endophyticum]|uniref:Lytic murein transglycosylase n=1 Tax=Altericroceibacterium endophyticum TaxID=1808508 RepID=A0A6I4T4I3_9SPHN|nr:lytic murein transglycosylase [Altericroceibacterium endophyticum]MXO64515.1 lytic murein transglycosylase [Altericroceibacterium endophyticum]
MKLFKSVLPFAAFLACTTGAQTACAQETDFDSYVQLVSAKARAEGVSEQTIRQLTAGLEPNPRVLALDTDNVGSSSSGSYPRMDSYIQRHNTQSRINGGKRVYARLRPHAQRLEREFGVPAEILIAIWGHETAYGAVTGSFDLVRSLATLAWEGRRRELFERELIDVMKIADSGVPRSQLQGSWAGAFGNSQFLPSVYLRLAVDEDGDGVRDIWNSDLDTLASIANYFHDAGWRTGQPWAVQAYVPNSVDRSAIAPRVEAPVCERVHERHSKWMTVAEWKKLGVIPRGQIADDVMASLFEPDGPANPGYLLTQNYRVILEYNCSNYYAMSVGLLGDDIAQ